LSTRALICTPERVKRLRKKSAARIGRKVGEEKDREAREGTIQASRSQQPKKALNFNTGGRERKGVLGGTDLASRTD